MKRIGICGTFDVANYGDLLFPWIAEKELSRRLGPIALSLFSYVRKSRPDWPYEVASLVDLPAELEQLSGLILGGGDLIRFDKGVAPGYAPPVPELHHPTGYWLTPMLMAAARAVPVAWNAPGVFGPIPGWAEPLLSTTIAASRYVSVRDERSRCALVHLAPESAITVVPDTAFGIGQLLAERGSSVEMDELRKEIGLIRPYIVVQATSRLTAFAECVRSHPRALDDYQILLVPICPALGDHEAALGPLPGALDLRNWPQPLLLAELISGAAAVVGCSLHLSITALTSGIPTFRPATACGGKYACLVGLPGHHPFDPETALDLHWFLERVRRGAAPTAAEGILERLSTHWDNVASAIQSGTASVGAEVVARFCQRLPARLEDAAIRDDAAATLVSERDAAIAERDAARVIASAAEAERDAQVARAKSLLAEERRRGAEQEAQVAALLRSTSWKATAPLRAVARRVRRWAGQARRRVRSSGAIDLSRFSSQRLETEPFEWSSLGGVFSSRDAAALAHTFPSDRFKTVTGYDGEKGYEYEARSIIHMGANAPTHADTLSAVWRRLAASLVSSEYRAALGRFTGIDLSAASMEANVFHYGPGAWLGPHLDLKDKLVTHVFYFNVTWDEADGGCLTILRSKDIADAVRIIAPVVGNSVVIVRSDRSWHAVSRVRSACARSRRSMTVTFYRPGSVSTLWPPGESPALHPYPKVEPEPTSRRRFGLFTTQPFSD